MKNVSKRVKDIEVSLIRYMPVLASTGEEKEIDEA